MMNDDVIHNKRDKKNRIFGETKVEIIALCIATFFLGLDFLFFLTSNYLEGRGVFPFFSAIYAAMINFFVGIPFCVTFIKIGTIKHKTYMRLIGIFLLFIFPAMFFAVVVTPRCLTYPAGFRDRLAARCDAQEMRDWTASFLKTHPAGEYEWRKEQVPNFIKKIYPKEFFSEWAYVSVKGEANSLDNESGHNHNKQYVFIAWGRRGGIAIGSKDLILENKEHDHYLKWQDGIYVWHRFQ